MLYWPADELIKLVVAFADTSVVVFHLAATNKAMALLLAPHKRRIMRLGFHVNTATLVRAEPLEAIRDVVQLDFIVTRLALRNQPQTAGAIIADALKSAKLLTELDLYGNGRVAPGPPCARTRAHARADGACARPTGLETTPSRRWPPPCRTARG